MSYSSLAAALGLSHAIAIPSIQSLLCVTQDLPMSWRKHILQTCRIQTLQSAHHLSTRLNSLQPTHVTTSVQDREISKQDLADMLDLLYGSPLLYSLLSFWTRGESIHPLIARDEIEQAIKKELSASQQEDRNQVLDYDIFVGAGSRLHRCTCIKSIPSWYNLYLDLSTFHVESYRTWEDVEGTNTLFSV